MASASFTRDFAAFTNSSTVPESVTVFTNCFTVSDCVTFFTNSCTVSDSVTVFTILEMDPSALFTTVFVVVVLVSPGG